jgi:hypothetical protein
MRFGHSRAYPRAIIAIGLVVAAANRDEILWAEFWNMLARPSGIGAATRPRLQVTKEASVTRDASFSATGVARVNCKAICSTNRCQNNGCGNYEKMTMEPISCHFLRLSRPSNDRYCLAHNGYSAF